MFTKSGIMVGLGEERNEVLQLMDDVRTADVDFLTIGQYLQPTRKHHKIEKFVTPDEFKSYETVAYAEGFLNGGIEPAHPLFAPRRRRFHPIEGGTRKEAADGGGIINEGLYFLKAAAIVPAAFSVEDAMAWMSDVRDAAHRLKTADRVLVIGCSGGGKTTLARTIATRFSLPFISMDREFFSAAGLGRTRTAGAAGVDSRTDQAGSLDHGRKPDLVEL